ncbi:hypothetical protein SCB49_00440 [unidentified eubacterium SCB49]|nr:hypothetical protein SCB49_00440 [unidentified eubacterium SCB49]
MKKIILLFAFFSSTLIFGQHTFSIVAVDPVTGEIGSAGATCIDAQDGALAISDIILGVGAIHTQSYWHPTNQANARVRMEAGDSPQEIMDWLVANDVSNAPASRQYGAVDLNDGSPRAAAFTGDECFAEYIHVTGPNYAIQGNILISEEVVTDMEAAFLAETGTLADKLMAALQGAKRPGADARCLDIGISSASAFIRVADPSDTDSSYGNLSLDLNVWITSEIFEPIDALQDMYDASLGINNFETSSYSVFPNPAKNYITVTSNKSTFNEYELFDVGGKLIEQNISAKENNRLVLDVSARKSGIYFLKLRNNGVILTTEKFLIK